MRTLEKAGVGGILAMMGKGKIAALLMLAGVIVPAIWAPRMLVSIFVLLIAGIVCFFVKPKQAAGARRLWSWTARSAVPTCRKSALTERRSSKEDVRKHVRRRGATRHNLL
jgi:hypothetical protein